MKTLYYNAVVYTGNDFRDAFVVEDGCFSYVGGYEKALEKITDKDTQVDLDGAFVCAGFNDSHMHLLNIGKTLSEARLVEHTSSKQEMYAYLKEYISKNPNLSWYKGRGWNQDLFLDENSMPTRKELDQLCVDTPMILTRACGHCAVVNTKALCLAGIDASTKAPLGGSIDYDNGLLYDNAISLVEDIMDLPSKEEIKKMIVLACEYLHSFGITSCQSDDYIVFEKLPYQVINQAYQELEEEHLLTVRVYEQANFKDPESFKAFLAQGNLTGVGSDYFKIGPLKMLGDGSLGSRTAHLSIPYQDDPSTSGFCLYTDEMMNEMVEIANAMGMQVAVHAIGDQCLDQVLTAIENALEYHPRKDHRHGIVHCQITREDQLEKMIDLNLNIYAQSIFLDYDNHIVEARVGKELASTSYHWKTLYDQGLNVSNGSDAPVEVPDVLKGIECAVTRTSLDGTGPYLLNQAFSVQEAIDTFTKNGALSSFEENKKGLIKENYFADFVILEKNPFEVEPQELHTIKVLKTYLAGQQV